MDSRHQSLACLYMILGQRDVSRILTGPLTPYTLVYITNGLKYFETVRSFRLKNGQTAEKLRGNLWKYPEQF